MDDSYVEDALTAALERFQRPRDQTVETDLETDGEESLVQLRKACRQLEAARTLRANNGYATSIIELSFAAIERSLQYYLQANGQYEPGEFQSHETVYSAAARPAMNLFSESLGDRFQTLWSQNRSAVYYRSTLATREQATAMFALAECVHRWIIEYAGVDYECRCSDLPADPYQYHTDQ